MVKVKDFRPEGNVDNIFFAFQEDQDNPIKDNWTIFGGDGNDMIAGDIKDDLLDGGNGNDFINGHEGADIMTGGDGDDTYIVENVGDQVIDGFFKGFDTVIASINYTLPSTAAGTFIENLKLIDGADTGRGNELANVLTANLDRDSSLFGGDGADTLIGQDHNDFLYGGGDSDTLKGGAGNDFLNGAAGRDIMEGNLGNDTYAVNSVFDQVIEVAGQGTDTVRVELDSSQNVYVLPDNIENMILVRNKEAKANGNGLNNEITGNDFRNEINAGSGHDLIRGMGGDDRIKAGSGTDRLFGGANSDVLFGGTGSDRLFGEEGNDFLIGFGGSTADKDSMTGGAGADMFYLGNARTVFYMTGDTFATIQDFSRAEGDKIAVSGSVAGYQLDQSTSFTGGSAVDTRVFFNGDLIATVVDSPGLSLATDFVTTTESFSI